MLLNRQHPADSEEYRQKYPSVFSLTRPVTSGGIAVVKNAAIRRCTGEYVALLDADDEFLKQKLAISKL